MDANNEIPAATARQLVPGLGESAEEAMQFFATLSKKSKFRTFFRSLFPWFPSPEQHHCILWQLIMAARNDSSGLLQFPSRITWKSAKYKARPNPWTRLLLRKEEEPLKSMITSFIREIYEFARPGQKINETEWVWFDSKGGKFEGMMFSLPEYRPNDLSHQVHIHVQMRIAPDQEGTRLLTRDVDLEVNFETNTDFGPVSGDEIRFNEDLSECMRPWSEFRKHSHSIGSPYSGLEQSAPNTTATPLVRLNAMSWGRSDDDPIGQVWSADGDQTSKLKVHFYWLCIALLFM